MSSPLTGRRIRLNKLKIIISEKKVIKKQTLDTTVPIQSQFTTVPIQSQFTTVPIQSQFQSNRSCNQTSIAIKLVVICNETILIKPYVLKTYLHSKLTYNQNLFTIKTSFQSNLTFNQNLLTIKTYFQLRLTYNQS